MDWDTLLDEAHRIARNSYLLLPGDTLDAAAFEGGELFRGRNFDAHHWITLRSDLMPDILGRDGSWTSVIAGPLDRERAMVVEWDHSPADFAPETLVLRAEPYVSLPPIEGIFRYGSERIEAWLKETGWERDQPFNPEFPDPLAARYDEYYLENSPHSHPEARAIVGGWHNFWPDGDWYMLCDYTPVVCDCTDRSVLLEVYFRAGEWLTIPRIV